LTFQITETASHDVEATHATHNPEAPLRQLDNHIAALEGTLQGALTPTDFSNNTTDNTDNGAEDLAAIVAAVTAAEKRLDEQLQACAGRVEMDDTVQLLLEILQRPENLARFQVLNDHRGGESEESEERRAVVTRALSRLNNLLADSVAFLNGELSHSEVRHCFPCSSRLLIVANTPFGQFEASLEALKW
jgi:hypothetical protein